jgi:hypothetical protein
VLPIGTECHGKDRVDVVLQIEEFLATGSFPKLCHFVIASRSDKLSIRTPGNGINAVIVALYRLEKLIGLNIPDPDFSPALWRATSRGE